MTSEVRAGALFLDKKQPGWENEIDVGLLHMGSMKNCVLGQLHGSYERGLGKLGITFEDESRLGLLISFRALLRPLILRYPYSARTNAWKQEIADRQAA